MEPLNLAICDDLPKEREALLALLEQAPIATNCTQFGSSEELLEAFRPGKFDHDRLHYFKIFGRMILVTRHRRKSHV